MRPLYLLHEAYETISTTCIGSGAIGVPERDLKFLHKRRRRHYQYERERGHTTRTTAVQKGIFERDEYAYLLEKAGTGGSALAFIAEIGGWETRAMRRGGVLFALHTLGRH
jgi:hypothetical protein